MSYHAVASHDVEGSNADPITGQPGSHPIGTGAGAAAAGVTGLAIGSALPGLGSFIGGAIGATIGAVAGGLAGKGVAEVIDPTAEVAFWRRAYPGKEYADDTYDFDRDFSPAYRYGWDAYRLHGHRDVESASEILRAGWATHRGHSRLDWEHAQHAVRDAWDRVSHLRKDAGDPSPDRR